MAVKKPPVDKKITSKSPRQAQTVNERNNYQGIKKTGGVKMRKRGRGAVRLGWCKECNLPLLGGKCSRCGGNAATVELTPPGDVRPAFLEDIRRLNTIADDDFGVTPFTETGVTLLSKIPSSDRADEVIVNGKVWSAIHFDTLRLKYEMLPRWEMVARMPRGRRWVDVDHEAAVAVLNGANMMAPGVLDADPMIIKGEEVVLFDDGIAVACGRARMNGSEMAGNRGFAVKVRQAGKPLPDEPAGFMSLKDTVEANSEYLA